MTAIAMPYKIEYVVDGEVTWVSVCQSMGEVCKELQADHDHFPEFTELQPMHYVLTPIPESERGKVFEMQRQHTGVVHEES